MWSWQAMPSECNAFAFILLPSTEPLITSQMHACVRAWGWLTWLSMTNCSACTMLLVLAKLCPWPRNDTPDASNDLTVELTRQHAPTAMGGSAPAAAALANRTKSVVPSRPAASMGSRSRMLQQQIDAHGTAVRTATGTAASYLHFHFHHDGKCGARIASGFWKNNSSTI